MICQTSENNGNLLMCYTKKENGIKVDSQDIPVRHEFL